MSLAHLWRGMREQEQGSIEMPRLSYLCVLVFIVGRSHQSRDVELDADASSLNYGSHDSDVDASSCASSSEVMQTHRHTCPK